MGLIVHDEITLSSGIVVTDTYASTGTSDVRTVKRAVLTMEEVDGTFVETTKIEYELVGMFTFWLNKTARDENKGSVFHKTINMKSDTPFTMNLYETLYTELKSLYTSYTDDI